MSCLYCCLFHRARHACGVFASEYGHLKDWFINQRWTLQLNGCQRSLKIWFHRSCSTRGLGRYSIHVQIVQMSMFMCIQRTFLHGIIAYILRQLQSHRTLTLHVHVCTMMLHIFCRCQLRTIQSLQYIRSYILIVHALARRPSTQHRLHLTLFRLNAQAVLLYDW